MQYVVFMPGKLKLHRLVADRSPDTSLPPMGERFSTDRLMLEPNRLSTYEVYFQDSADVIVVPFTHGKIEAAFDTDRVRPLSVEPFRLHFHPAESTTYARHVNDARDFICMRIDPEIRLTLLDDMGVAATDVRPLTNVLTPRTRIVGHQLRQFLANSGLGGRLVAESLATLAMAEAVKKLGGLHDEVASFGKIPPKEITRVIEFVETNLDRDLSLVELARVASLSVFHFARRFKETMGMPPHAYVTERRLQRATELLHDPELTLANIAYACGFSNQSHFTTIFKNHTGVTPGTYRKDVLT